MKSFSSNHVKCLEKEKGKFSVGSTLALTVIFSQNLVKEVDSFNKGPEGISAMSDWVPLCFYSIVRLPSKVNFEKLGLKSEAVLEANS